MPKKSKKEVEETLQKILKLKEDNLSHSDICNIMGFKDTSSVTYYLNKVNYKPKKLKFICENEWCKEEYEYYDYKYDINNKKHKKCKKCREYEKKCPVCDKPHNNQGLTCSNNCAWELKKETYLKSCGAEHNFCKNSENRILWEDRIFLESGVTNIFQLDTVKEKCKKTLYERYGVYYTGQILDKRVKHRITLEDKGILVPLCDMNEYNIYRNNVLSFTAYNLRVFGEKYLGENYNKNIGITSTNDHIDHIYSIHHGYINKIPSYIIGSIVNLRIMSSRDNISKKTRCDISKDDLLKTFEEFETNIEYNDLLSIMKSNRSKYYELYFKLKMSNDIIDNNELLRDSIYYRNNLSDEFYELYKKLNKNTDEDCKNNKKK